MQTEKGTCQLYQPMIHYQANACICQFLPRGNKSKQLLSVASTPIKNRTLDLLNRDSFYVLLLADELPLHIKNTVTGEE